MNAHGYEGDEQRRRTPTAITSKNGMVLVNVVPNGTASKFEFLTGVISRLAQLKVVPDLMCTSEQSVSFAISPASRAISIDELVAEIEHLGIVSDQP